MAKVKNFKTIFPAVSVPLNQEEKDWIAEGIRRSGLEKVDMSKFA